MLALPVEGGAPSLVWLQPCRSPRPSDCPVALITERSASQQRQGGRDQGGEREPCHDARSVLCQRSRIVWATPAVTSAEASPDRRG